MADDPTDAEVAAFVKANAEFLRWARETGCTDEAMEKAKADTKRRLRRHVRAEYGRVWARMAFAEVRKGKKAFMVEDAQALLRQSGLKVSEKTIWNALKPPPKAPPLDEARVREILTANLAFAESVGNTRAVAILRRWLKRLSATTF